MFRENKVIPVTPPDLKANGNNMESSALHECAADGDVAGVASLIREGHDVNGKHEGLTPLHYAVRYHHLEVARELVKNKANPKEKGKFDMTPLHYVANYSSGAQITNNNKSQEPDYGHSGPDDAISRETSMIEYLISLVDDINEQDAYGATPLNRATVSGNEIAADILLRNTDDKRSTVPICKLLGDKEGRTALHWAVLFSRLDILKLLLKKFPKELDRGDKKNTTPLHLAATEGNIEALQIIYSKAGDSKFKKMLESKDIYNNTCLHSAVMMKRAEIIEFCLEKGADVNFPDGQNMSPLHLAAEVGDVPVMRGLVKYNAGIDSRNNEGRTPLHVAAMNNRLKAISFLVTSRANIDEKDNYGLTPLLLAVKHGQEEAVKHLLELHANCAAVDKKDKTAIILATEENVLHVVEVLLEWDGLQPHVSDRDCDEKTAVAIAAEKGNLPVLKRLLDKGGRLEIKDERLNTPLHLAAQAGQTGTVKEILIRQRRLLEDRNMDSNTALHLAAINRNDRVADELVKHGAYVKARNNEKWTPLMYAASTGCTKTCLVLLEAGAYEENRKSYQTTPQHLASQNGHASVVELLMKYGASIALRDEQHRNCLDLAIQKNHKEVAISIVKSIQWENALRNENADKMKNRITPMRKLIRHMPDVAEIVLNQCISVETAVDMRITFTYEFIDDTSCDWWNDSDVPRSENRPEYQTTKSNHPLSIMVESDQEQLLHHPVVGALINFKWQKAGRNFFYMILALYLVFLGALTGYIATTKPPWTVNATGYSISDCEVAAQTGVTQDPFAQVAQYFILVLAVANIIKEIAHVIIARKEYLSWKIFIDWSTFVLSFLFVLSYDTCQITTGYRYEWQWSVGTVAVILAWIYLALIIRVTRFGIYVVMLGKMFSQFKEFLIVLLLFDMAFTLGFYILLQNQGPYSDIIEALIKTSSMMIGELTFDDIFHTDGQLVYYRSVSLAAYIFFTVIMAILIMNLLVAMVVAGYEEVQAKAELQRRILEVERALSVEWLYRGLWCTIFHPSSVMHHGHYTVDGHVVRESGKQCEVCKQAPDDGKPIEKTNDTRCPGIRSIWRRLREFLLPKNQLSKKEVHTVFKVVMSQKAELYAHKIADTAVSPVL